MMDTSYFKAKSLYSSQSDIDLHTHSCTSVSVRILIDMISPSGMLQAVSGIVAA